MNLISYFWRWFQNWIIIWTSWDIEYAGTRLTTSGTRLHQYHHQNFSHEVYEIFYRLERTKILLLWFIIQSSKSVKFSMVPLYSINHGADWKFYFVIFDLFLNIHARLGLTLKLNPKSCSIFDFVQHLKGVWNT